MKAAKKAFFELEGCEFPFGDYYDILKDCDKFKSLCDKENTKNTRKTKNGDAEAEVEARPLGNKRAIAALSKSKQDDSEMNELFKKKMKLDDSFNNLLIKAMNERNFREHDRAIMSVDPSTVKDEVRRAYYMLEQEEILARHRKETEIIKNVEEIILNDSSDEEVTEVQTLEIVTD